MRIFQTPHTLDAAIEVVAKARDLAGNVRFRHSACSSSANCRKVCLLCSPALKKAGLETITQAPIDRLVEPERALEALTDAGLQLARLTVNETPEREWTTVCRDVAALQTRLRAIRAFAPLARKIDADPADDRLRRCQARRDFAPAGRQRRHAFRSIGRCTVRSSRRSR